MCSTVNFLKALSKDRSGSKGVMIHSLRSADLDKDEYWFIYFLLYELTRFVTDKPNFVQLFFDIVKIKLLILKSF